MHKNMTTILYYIFLNIKLIQKIVFIFVQIKIVKL